MSEQEGLAMRMAKWCRRDARVGGSERNEPSEPNVSDARLS